MYNIFINIVARKEEMKMSIDWGMVGAIATIVSVIVAIFAIVKSNGKDGNKNNREGNKQKVRGFIISNNEIKQENK